MFPSSFRKIFVSIAGFGVLGSYSQPSRACGPDFPNAYLFDAGDGIAALPTLCFAAELARLLPPGTSLPDPMLPSVNPHAGTGEIAEVRAALTAAGVPRRQIETALANYVRDNPPAALPHEFHLYARGAQAWHAGRTGEALAAWRELLALPADARHYRTVWAGYMMGRALWDSDGVEACAAFRAVREAVKNGFADSEELAVASLGWEARVYLRRGSYDEALRLYFRQYAAGDPSAVGSMQLTVQRLFQFDDDSESVTASGQAPAAVRVRSSAALSTIAADRQLRGIVTAWFVSRGGPMAPWTFRATKQFRRWLESLPHTNTLAPVEADRWAWAAYQNGLWDDAAAFAQLAPSNAAASEWVRAMLLLRKGEVGPAADHLAGAARGFPEDPALNSRLFRSEINRFESTQEDLPAVRLGGVRGVLALQREQYVESLRLFLTAGHWADAAYVAERVLTLTELVNFVKAETSRQSLAIAGDDRGWDVESRVATADHDLRYLLARRLVRAGQFDLAREFFPSEVLANFDRYVGAVRTGYREDLPASQRAEALWKAAGIAWEHGMEIQGTELEPDYAVWGGNYEWPSASRTRSPSDERRNWTGVASALMATSDEFQRVSQVVLPRRRFHYRQRAAELAFLSATLLPDNNDQTALILNTAGRWIAARYPEDAELFYKTLVFRCPHTSLGREAAARRWFVPPNSFAPDTEGPPPKT